MFDVPDLPCLNKSSPADMSKSACESLRAAALGAYAQMPEALPRTATQKLTSEAAMAVLLGRLLLIESSALCASDNQSPWDKLPKDVADQLKQLGVTDIAVTRDGDGTHVELTLKDKVTHNTGDADAPQLWLDQSVKFDVSKGDGGKIELSNLSGVGVLIDPHHYLPTFWVYPSSAKIAPTDGGATAEVTAKKAYVLSSTETVHIPKETYDAIKRTADALDK